MRVHFLGSASGFFSHGTRVSSQDCGDEGAIGGNSWGIAREMQPSERIGRKQRSTASSSK
jgi:hypothetical protein